MHDLDEVDFGILRLLQENAALTNKQIASKLKMSATPIFERVKKLEKSGVIRNYSAILDREMVGKGLLVFCNVTVKEHTEKRLKNFEQDIQKVPEVVECHLISGNADYVLKIVVENMAAYNAFLHKLSRFENISNTNSIMVLREIKSTSQIPL